jgi:hypothetical protein
VRRTEREEAGATGTKESRAEDGAMEAGVSSRYPLWTRGGVHASMEGMRGGVWKGRARMEGRRGRRMVVGFAGGDLGRGAREGGSQRQGRAWRGRIVHRVDVYTTVLRSSIYRYRYILWIYNLSS